MAAPMKNISSDLLYPELLTREGLLDVLKQRYIKKPDLQCLDKEELLKLYYQYIIPLPQRKYRQNRHGRDMTRKQILAAKKRKLITVEEEPPKKKNTLSAQSTSSDFSPTPDRIKPPPSCINFNKKVIKLNSEPKIIENEQVVDISSRVKKLSTNPLELSEKNKLISLKQTVNNINKHLNSDNSSQNKRERLKRKETAMEVESESKVTKECNEPKKKISRISWP